MSYPETRPPAFTLTTGPVDAYPEVLRALGTTVLYDYDPVFQAHYETVARKAGHGIGMRCAAGDPAWRTRTRPRSGGRLADCEG